MEPTMQEIIDSIPTSIKEAVTTHQSVKLAEVATGITDFTVAGVAQYFGEKLASRRMKWRPIAEGLIALEQLKGR
jgi:hypothetical protein